ncbi:MAG: peptidoglycan-binding protein [Dermatophilaceae bacterium]
MTANVLNVRYAPTTDSRIAKTVKRGQVYTIIETAGDWGKLKSGAGWIHLGYTSKDTSKPAPAPTPPATGTTLRRGSTGEAVYKLQAGLLRVFPAYAHPIRTNGGPNRTFGPATEKVVKEFQKRSALKVDGVVGDATRAALGRYGIRW